MDNNFEIQSLLPIEKVKRSLQLFASPSFSSSDTASGLGSVQRTYYVHLFTGRMPTAAEWLYGITLNKKGDVLASRALSTTEQRIGYFMLTNDANFNKSHRTTTYHIGTTMRASPAQPPEGVTYAPSTTNNGVRNIPLDPDHDLSRLLNWTFSASHTVTLDGSQVAAWHAYGDDVVGERRPTWFAISESTAQPFTNNIPIYHPNDQSSVEAYLSIFGGHPLTEYRPVIMGTVGELGSDADLQLIEGGDTYSDTIRVAALRVSTELLPMA